MPTLTPQEQPHERRDVAESFGSVAADYDRARPDYPATMIARIVEAAPGRRFLDVGIGTGIAARQFAAAGCTVLGVEPDERMAALARTASATHTRRAAHAQSAANAESAAHAQSAAQGDRVGAPGIEVEVAKFEEWEPRGRRFDAVVAAQAWHWVDPLGGAAKAAAVLESGGRLTVFWNVFQPPPEVGEILADAYRRYLPQMPVAAFDKPAAEQYRAMTDQAAQGMIQTGAFHAPEEWRTDWSRDYTRAEWLELLPTQGGMTRLPTETRDAMLAELAGRIGAFTARYTTVAVTARRRQAASTWVTGCPSTAPASASSASSSS